VIAKKQARNAIGFEKDTRFFEMAKARIEAEQLELIFTAPGDGATIVGELDKLMDEEMTDLAAA